MADNSIVSATQISLSYGNQLLLEQASFAIGANEKVGLVGRNGCGKSSLLAILASLNSANSGEIALRRDLVIGYLPQQCDLSSDMSVLEYILQGAGETYRKLLDYENHRGDENELHDLALWLEQHDGWNLHNRAKALASSLQISDLEASILKLSGGQLRRVALARALVSLPDLLLLDEPTNHLDTSAIDWLEEYLCRYNGAVLFVTHDRYFLQRIATRILELDNGSIYSHPGNYDAYLEHKALRRQISEQTERRRQRFLREELEWVRAGVKARTTKSRHRMEQFYNIQGLEAPPEEREMDLLIPPACEIGNQVIELLNVGYMLPDGRWLFRNLTLSIKPKQCLGIVGANGVGKTTLIKICLGELQPSEGEVRIGPKVQSNYIDQVRELVDEQSSILDVVAEGQQNITFGNTTINARSYLKRFLFSQERLGEKAGLLSGGEKARLALAKTLRKPANLLVLDEPTNDLDLASLRLLEDALVDYDGSCMVVSHDRYFLDRICDTIIGFSDYGLQVVLGNYSNYLQHLASLQQAYKQQSTPAAGKSSRSRQNDSGAPKRRSFKQQREWESIEDDIQQLEAQALDLENKLNCSDFYVENFAKIGELGEELQSLHQRIEALYARWDELAQMSDY